MTLTASQARLLAAARSYLGVPWRHRGRTRIGLDCAGLPRCMYVDCGASMPDRRDYGRDPFQQGFESVFEQALGAPVWSGPWGSCMRRVLQPADVVLMTPAGKIRHAGVLGDHPLHGLSLIHAEGPPGRGMVVEDGLSDLDLRKITKVFRCPLEVVA